MNKLNMSDIKTVELSIDQVGRIFFYEKRVFRAINDEYIDQVKDMFDCGLIEELINKKLFPKTWISDMQINGYRLVIEHEKITYWNYPYEWSFDMLKDAGLLVLEVNKIANRYGYELIDSHSSNVVFNMNKPQYIDFGSFAKVNNNKSFSWESYTIFYNHFYIPLYLWSNGYSDIARNIFLMRDYFSQKEFLRLKHPIINLFDNKYIFKFMNKLRTIAFTSDKKIKDKLESGIKQKVVLLIHKMLQKIFNIQKLEKEITSLIMPSENSMWNNYHDNIDPKTNKRFLRIIEILNTFKDAKSLVELASNQGKFASLVIENTHIEKVIATDYDKEAVNIMYMNNKDRTNFLPLLFDMVRTNGRKCDKYIHERIKSDVIIGLAITHHLILTQNIPIDYIFSIMKNLTNKYIIVEFMPIGLYAGDLDKVPELPSFYNLNWFKNNFINYFELILDEELEMNRYIFVGKIRKVDS